MGSLAPDKRDNVSVTFKLFRDFNEILSSTDWCLLFSIKASKAFFFYFLFLRFRPLISLAIWLPFPNNNSRLSEFSYSRILRSLKEYFSTVDIFLVYLIISSGDFLLPWDVGDPFGFADVLLNLFFC